jgi:hypothetical protein
MLNGSYIQYVTIINISMTLPISTTLVLLSEWNQTPSDYEERTLTALPDN